MTVEPGLSASVGLQVLEGDTALALRSGDVEVLATPRLVALCEQACCSAVDGRLGAGETSVGTRVVLDHVAAARVGDAVTATAALDHVAGRRLTFSVEARRADGTVLARGTVERVVVDRRAFLARAGVTGP